MLETRNIQRGTPLPHTVSSKSYVQYHLQSLGHIVISHLSDCVTYAGITIFLVTPSLPHRHSQFSSFSSFRSVKPQASTLALSVLASDPPLLQNIWHTAPTVLFQSGGRKEERRIVKKEVELMLR